MRIDPGHQILQVWHAVAQFSFRGGTFIWGAPARRDSISDAQQLLCILLPATELPAFRLDRPEHTAGELLETLRYLGDRNRVPQELVRTLTEYLSRYSDSTGQPTFPAGTYLTSLSPQQTQAERAGHPRALIHPDADTAAGDVVEAFAISIRLTLAAIGFCRVLRQDLTDAKAIAETEHLERLANLRLTSALIGLLRSFVIHWFDDNDTYGANLRRAIRQDHRNDHDVLAEFDRSLYEVRAGLRDITIGIDPASHQPAGAHFECGWSWAPVTNAPPVRVDIANVAQRPGSAPAVPHLYFTLVALAAIPALTSQRTRILGLLTDEQQRLASALQFRSNVTQAYWRHVATFGDHQWPVERFPWRTTTGEESDYYSLLLTAIIGGELGTRRGNNDVDVGHLVRIIAGILRRRGITRPPHRNDGPTTAGIATEILTVERDHEELPSTAIYRAAGIIPLTFTTALQIAETTDNTQLRQDLEELADRVWDHYIASTPQRHDAKPASINLKTFSDDTAPNWHNILHVVEGLVTAVDLAAPRHLSTRPGQGSIYQLLAETEDLQRRLEPHTQTAPAEVWASIQSSIDRARTLIDSHPGRAAAVLYRTLATLDQLLLTQQLPTQPPTSPDG